MGSKIISIGVANPAHCIEQQQVYQFMGKAHGFTGSALNRLQALYRATGIRQRYSVIGDYRQADSRKWNFYPNSEQLEPFPTTSHRADLYRKNAARLSVRATQEALQQTHLVASDFTHLITVSCTGMYAPGLDIDLVHELGLNTSIQRSCINFMGCYAAFTAIKLGDQICKANENAKVLIVATELCTIHFQKSGDDDNLLANAIFGDGSAALVMSSQRADSLQPTVLSPEAFLNDIYPEGADEMAWGIGNFGFEMKLSAYVPTLIEKGIGHLVTRLLASTSNQRIDHYALHPGGKKILEVIEKALGIEKHADWAGRKVLAEYGNMSSPTILFVLKMLWESLDSNHKDHRVLALAFGPGLTMESMLLRLV